MYAEWLQLLVILGLFTKSTIMNRERLQWMHTKDDVLYRESFNDHEWADDTAIYRYSYVHC